MAHAKAPPPRPDAAGRGPRVWALPAVLGFVLCAGLFLLVFVHALAWWCGTHTWQWPGTGG
ncbi:hypothetical protein ACFY0F_03310 [Streptomyces sp. NPDC001544]|uniref:hypothetical protein n=1 Tax=Streptomyces sp. NPDC001544 TaxID=3364584 RepID=UPI0036A94A68